MAEQTRNELIELRDLIREFVEERDWDQFHTPKNLAVSLCGEAAELQEPFQWLPTGAPSELSKAKQEHVRHEIVDVFVYLLRLPDKLNVDLGAAVRDKLALNRAKYPAELVRGSALKTTSANDSGSGMPLHSRHRCSTEDRGPVWRAKQS